MTKPIYVHFTYTKFETMPADFKDFEKLKIPPIVGVEVEYRWGVATDTTETGYSSDRWWGFDYYERKIAYIEYTKPASPSKYEVYHTQKLYEYVTKYVEDDFEIPAYYTDTVSDDFAVRAVDTVEAWAMLAGNSTTINYLNGPNTGLATSAVGHGSPSTWWNVFL